MHIMHLPIDASNLFDCTDFVAVTSNPLEKIMHHGLIDLSKQSASSTILVCGYTLVLRNSWGLHVWFYRRMTRRCIQD